MTILLFAVALSLSAVSAYYAVMGLVAIFAAAAIPIAVMGTLLEVSKLTVASWLYRSWNEIPVLMKSYFMVALIVLMLLTSMGIFGFLSKAHLDQAVPTGDSIAKLEIIDDKINTQRENINVARTTISQLDRQVEETLNRTASDTTSRGVTRSVTIRRNQARERSSLAKSIEASQTEIARLTQERIPLAQEVRKIEAEVGPIKYIAALMYGETNDASLLESAVRIVTLMIVFVFDPLAVLLLVAANWQLKRDATPKKPTTSDFLKKSNLEDFGVEETPKEIVVEDQISLKESHEVVSSEELPEIQVDENQKEWEPELYERVEKPVHYDSIGRRITPLSESKTKSFLEKVQNSVGTKTIEKEIDDLQKPQK
jgi:hypothetical protein